MTLSAATDTLRPRALRDLPSPSGLPILGHLTRLDPLRAHTQFEQWARELGTPYRIHMAGMPIVIWDDVEVFQQILRERPQRWRRGGRIRPVAREMGFDGVFAAEGDDWAPQRRLVMQALNPAYLRGFFPTLQAITARLHRRWLAAADEGRVVEMTEDLMRYTVDVTSALAFGEDPNTLDNEGDSIQRNLAAVFPMFMKRVMTPISHWRWFKLPADLRLDRDLAAVQAYIAALIARTRERMRADGADAPRNLLESFLQQRDAPGSAITDDMVSANVLTLLLAGEDTTAHSLAWTLPYLSAEPAWQDKLHNEACAALGDDAVCPGAQALRGLDLCEAAVTEAQRLRPVVAIQSFEALQDTVIGGVAMPRDVKIFFINRPALMDERHFHEPRRYDPERWLRGREAQHGAHEPRAFLQFGAGPRVCPGRHLAGVEMRLVMSMLMREFEVELAIEGARIEEISAFTVAPSRMPLRLRRRTRRVRPTLAVAVPRAGCPHHPAS
jgi:cytochrome P450